MHRVKVKLKKKLLPASGDKYVPFSELRVGEFFRWCGVWEGEHGIDMEKSDVRIKTGKLTWMQFFPIFPSPNRTSKLRVDESSCVFRLDKLCQRLDVDIVLRGKEV